MITQDKSKRKASGGRYTNSHTKRVAQIGNNPVLTKIGEKKVKSTRSKGGRIKLKLASTDIVNLFDPKTKKFVKAKLKGITENSANRHFIRRSILTKGAIIETDKGKAKITSRPGQVSVLNAILV